jgi:hypothetical protein
MASQETLSVIILSGALGGVVGTVITNSITVWNSYKERAFQFEKAELAKSREAAITIFNYIYRNDKDIFAVKVQIESGQIDHDRYSREKEDEHDALNSLILGQIRVYFDGLTKKHDNYIKHVRECRQVFVEAAESGKWNENLRTRFNNAIKLKNETKAILVEALLNELEIRRLKIS